MNIEALGAAGSKLPTIHLSSQSALTTRSANTGTEPDIALPHGNIYGASSPTAASYFADFMQQSANALQKAQSAERLVAQGHGSLLAMSVDRARADVLLSVMSAAASRFSNALSTFANMAV